MRKLVIRIAVGVAALIVLLAAWLAVQWLPSRPKLVVSRETTWITGPLLPDGTVDYEASWRDERSKGLTSENNAGPFLFATLGVDVSQFTEEERAALPKDIARFVAFGDWRYDHEKSLPAELFKEFIDVEPALAALENGESKTPAARLGALWLDANAACLPGIERAVQRDRLFAPAAYRFGEEAWEMFEFHRAFRGSASIALANGDADAAFAHLASSLRLARLQRALGPGAQYIVAQGGEASTWACALKLARRAGRVSGTATRELLAAADPSDADARLRASVASSRMSALDFLAHPRPLSEGKSSFVDELFARVDPNRSCRRFNESMDRIEAAFCTGSWNDRLDRVGRLQQQLAEASAGWKEDGGWLRAMWSRDAFGDAAIDAVMAVNSRQVIEVLVPAILQAERNLIEFAALAYATETGHDPKSSDDLTPLLFEKPWRDRVTGARVTFERDDDGNLVARGPLIDLQTRFEEWSKKPVSKRAH